MNEPRGKTQGSVRRQKEQQHLLPSVVRASVVDKKPDDVDDEGAAAGEIPGKEVLASSCRPGENDSVAASGKGTSGAESVVSRTRRWGYRRGPREELRRNLFGRFAPVFFYPLAQVRCDTIILGMRPVAIILPR